MPNPNAATWTSLEVVKLLVSGMTPVLIAIMGVYLNQRVKKFEHRQWRNQKLIEKRLAIYDELAPLLNELLCYYTFVGQWKEFTPPEIIKRKREIDKKVHIARAIFSILFFQEIMNFMRLCFKTYQGWGVDAKMMTTFDQRKNAFGANWDPDWENLFYSEVTPREKIKESYILVMEAFSHDIGLYEEPTTTGGKIG